MSDNNRGAYTPQSEAPLAFDARRSRGPEERGRPNVLIISGLVLAVLVIAFVVFAMTRMGGGDVDEPETFDAMKTPPEAAEVAEAPGLVVESVESLAAEEPTFTPPPEEPAPIAAEPAAPSSETVAAPKAPANPKTAEPKAAPEPKPSAAPPSSAAQVQIGAFSSAALAEREWNEVALSIPAQMAGKTLLIEETDVDGETRYRSLIGGFSSRAEADAFCERLKGAGHACFARN